MPGQIRNQGRPGKNLFTRRNNLCRPRRRFPDRRLVKATLSVEFVKALEAEVDKGTRKPLIKMVTLRQIVGRATWAFGLVLMLRPILAPLWAILAELTGDAKLYDNKQKPKHAKVLGRDVAVEVKRVLPELLWIRAVLRRAIGRGELARTVDARVFVG